ncbi:10213_t:CDS:2 [Funneliformis geosporum]|nr:10213_t:CDS:2 [Funneliformis geosporum]
MEPIWDEVSITNSILNSMQFLDVPEMEYTSAIFVPSLVVVEQNSETQSLQYLPKSNLNTSISIVRCVGLRIPFSQEYIIQGVKKYPSCFSCPVKVYLIREEAVLASDGSRARQGSQSKQVTMQDQATSPIMIGDEDDDDNWSNSVDNHGNSNDEILTTNTQNNLENQSNENSGMTPRRISSRQSLRRTSPRITCEQERFQVLLQELSTPAKGEKAENDDAKENGDGASSQSLVRLYQKATRAGLHVTKANQDEILCWYKHAEDKYFNILKGKKKVKKTKTRKSYKKS